MDNIVKAKSRKPRVSSKEMRTRMDLFLKSFASHGHFEKAARDADLAVSTAYRHIRSDEDLQQRFKEAEQMACIVLRDEILRRAVEGVAKPVYYKGVKCGEVREHSDKLLIYLLQARCPEFRPNYKSDSEDESGPLPKLTIKVIDSLADIENYNETDS